MKAKLLKRNSRIPRSPRRIQNPTLRSIYRYRYEYLVFLPVFAFFIIFHYVPMYGVTLAFKNYRILDGILGSPWLDPWYKNFQRIFTSDLAMRSIKNTLAISLSKIVLSVVLPLTFAVLLDELPFPRIKKFTQTLSYFPYFISWVVVGGIVRMLLSPSNGPINYILELLTGNTIYFMAEDSMFRSLVLITYVWHGIGYNTVIYLAAIASVDQEQYDAARVDGASRWQLIWNITLPAILPTVTTMLILSMGNIMSAGFDQIFNLYSPATYNTGDVINTYIYRVGIQDLQFSFATAVGLFQNVVGLTMVVLSNLIIKRIDPENSIF